MIRQCYLVVACLQYCTFTPICAVSTNSTEKPLELSYKKLENPYAEFCKPNVSTNLKHDISAKCLCISKCIPAESNSLHTTGTKRTYGHDLSTCTALTTSSSPYGAIRYVSNMYKIVDKCGNMVPCSQFEVATWGSMYPVYSNTTDTIYLNEKCASCNSDEQVVKWEIEVNCPTPHMLHTYITEGFTRAMKGVLQEEIECSFRFLPPPHADLNHKLCFRLQYSIFYSSDSVTKEFNRLCSGNYTSYGYNSEMPAYVFNCFPCSDIRKSISDIACNIRTSNRKAFVPLSFLLNGESIAVLTRQLIPNRRKSTGECDIDEIPERRTGFCRRLRCPDGQIQMERKCQYISSKWTAGPFISFLKLEPYGTDDKVLSKNIGDIVLYKGRFFNYKLKSWARQLYYHALRNETYVRYFVLLVTHKRATFRPDVFFKNFEISLNSPWVLHIAGRNHWFKANIHTSFLYTVYNESFLKPELAVEFPSYRNGLLTPVIDGLLPDAITFNTKRTVISLTTFFLCKQVDLRPSEFFDVGKWVYLNITDRFIEEVEFRRYYDVDGNKTISVCMSTLGSDFWQVSNGISDLWNERHIGFKLFVSLIVTVLEIIDFRRH